MIQDAKSLTERKISSLHTFLERICAEPSKYASDLVLTKALSRQDRLGAYENPTYGVMRSSRSSIERVCSKLLPGGCKEFDALRLKALNQLKAVIAAKERIRGPKRRTREHFREQVALLEREVNLRLVDCLHLTTAIHHALIAGRHAVTLSRNPAANEYWNREEKVLLSMLTLSKKLVVRSASAEEKWASELRCIS